MHTFEASLVWLKAAVKVDWIVWQVKNYLKNELQRHLGIYLKVAYWAYSQGFLGASERSKHFGDQGSIEKK